MELLRFTTAGSVDDGKSTLIGRLLYDSKSIFEDQLEAVKQAAVSRGNEEVNLALLTDGLRAEREQGITIDVAYRYFATPKRKFIIADTPGHIQYTRNMVTGASTADLAVILIDVRNGVIEQTVRHTCIANLLGIPYITVCVNKMDMVDFDQDRFSQIREQFLAMARRLNIKSEILFIPISAKYGDNVVDQSHRIPWYDGPSLMQLLETVPICYSTAADATRLPVQYVIRPISDRFPDYRAYAGRLASGSLRVGDRVMVYPSGLSSTVKAIMQTEASLDHAFSPQSISVLLDDDIDISRGDCIVTLDGRQPQVLRNFSALCCWLNPQPLQLRKRYIVKTTVAESVGIVDEIEYILDVNTLSQNSSDSQAMEATVSSQLQSGGYGGNCVMKMNDIGCIKLRTANPMVLDSYADNHITGSFIIIDPDSFETVGAAMVK